MAPSSKQVRTLVSPAGSVVAERVPKGTQQPFKAEMSGSKSPFHSGRRRTDVHPDVVRPFSRTEKICPDAKLENEHD